MRHKYKGFKGNVLEIIEKKMYKDQNTKKIKKIYKNSWLFRGHPYVLHKARCSGSSKVLSVIGNCKAECF